VCKLSAPWRWAPAGRCDAPIDRPAGTKTQLSSNRGDRAASFVERSDFVKHGLAGGVAPAAQQTFVRCDLRATNRTFDAGLLTRVRIVFDLDGGCPDRRLETAELPLHGFLEVLQQVKAVSDLSRLRRALARGVRIEASAIAADDLDFRMPLEPVCRGPGRAIRQQFHHLATLQVDE
jgi:hypothetical protein